MTLPAVVRPRCGQEGFSLIEAVVALAVIAAALLPLYGVLNTAIVTIGRVEDANIRSAAMRQALAVLDGTNPMERPNGHMDLGAFGVEWQARPIVRPTPAVAADGVGPTGFRVALYETRVTLNRAGKPWFSFSVRQLGHSRVDRSVPNEGKS